MALSLKQTIALKDILKPGMKVASMGYPDIIATIDFIHSLWPDLNDFECRQDSQAICKRHGLQKRPIPDAHSFFSLLGCDLHVYDVVQERGCERLCDLNDAGSLKYANNFYDIVLDVGTAEHCFNIGQALFNMAGMVKLGGHIIHENPGNCFNHGFYSLNPTLFADFYAANGFEVIECKLVDRNGAEANVPHTKRFRFTGQEVNVFCLARRIEVQSFVMPCQSKYKGLIQPDAGVPGDRDASERVKEVING